MQELEVEIIAGVQKSEEAKVALETVIKGNGKDTYKVGMGKNRKTSPITVAIGIAMVGNSGIASCSVLTMKVGSELPLPKGRGFAIYTLLRRV